jgi:cobalt-zinc-cadmium efflux system membrane fusion protein
MKGKPVRFQSTQNVFYRFAAAVCLSSLAACSQTPKDTPPMPAFVSDHGLLRIPEHSPLRSRLQVQTVELRDVPHSLIAPAMVEADPARTANILPPLAGKITALKVGLGDTVHRGQLLAVIASGDFAQAVSDAAKARDALDLAKKSLSRAQGVQQAGGAAVKDLQAAQSTYTQALDEDRRAQARLAAVGGADEKGGRADAHGIQVLAPMSGSITALSIAPGTYVNDVTASMMTLVNLDSVWVTADVAEDDLALVKPGDSADVSLSAYPGIVLHGRVATVGSVLQPDTRRGMVRIVMANADGRLKPNMFATATFAAPAPAQVFVPDSALLMNNDSTTVLVEVSPWTFQRRTVQLGDDEGAGTRVLSGLHQGDRVVVKGGVLLNE